MDWRAELERTITAIPANELPDAVGELERHCASALLQVPSSRIPDVLGDLERAKAFLLARFLKPEENELEEDPLLTADQVAEMLQVDRKWVYRHKSELGSISLSRRKLRFPLSQVKRYIRRRKAASTRR